MRQASENTAKIARSAGLVSAAVLCSRVLGLIREQVFAIFFGAGHAYDAFVVAFRIPNLLRDLFGEGALSAAFVTVFSDYDATKGEKETWRLANNVLTFFAVFLSLLTLLGIYFAEDIVRLMVQEEYEVVAGQVALTSQLTMIMFPFLLFISMSAVVMGGLNSKGRFFVPALASSFFNLGSIVGGLSCAYILHRLGQPAIVGMAIGTLIGGGLQLFSQLPSFKAVGFRLRPRLDLADPGLRRILLLMGPAVVGLSATQLNIFVNNNYASACGEGSLSWLQYAFRLVQLPIGLFGVALSMASLPLISRYAAKGDIDSLRETFSSALIMVFCLAIPATVGLWMLSEPIIALIFEHGRFTAEDTRQTAAALRFYAIGLFAYAAVKVTVPVFYALRNTRVPVVGSFIAVAINLALVSQLVKYFDHRAIALSISGALIANLAFLLFKLHGRLGSLPLRYIATGVAKAVMAAIAMGLWLALYGHFLAPLLQGGVFLQLLLVVGAVASGALTYGACLHFAGVREFSEIVLKLRQRLASLSKAG
ncbi:MAG: murein biosynthesis integral membrane protein MurJ [Thermodesulfobacteriota bacterium]